MHYLGFFFTGAFLCNALPHVMAGVQGATFPSPFAKPPGKGLSSPLVNFYWGMFNLVAGLGLVWWLPETIGFNAAGLCVLLGAAVIGTHLAWHFGRVLGQSK